MYYFYYVETGEVTTRQHEFNSEAMDGEIILIDENDLCTLLIHTPNKKFSWDVKIVSKLAAKDGLEKLEALGTLKTAKTGYPYYCLIKENLLNLYLEVNPTFDFHVIDKKEVNKQMSFIAPRQEGAELTSRQRYKTKLVRDGETPIKF